MRIPHVGGTNASFGNRGPDRLGPANLDTRGMTAGIDALGDVGRAGMQIAGQAAQVIAADRREDEALALAKGTNALLDYDLQVKAKTAELQSRQETGDLDWRDLESEANTAFDEIEAPTFEGLAPDDQIRVQGALARTKAEAMLGVGTLARAGKRVETKGQVVKIRDTLGKLASDPNADVDKLVSQGALLRDVSDGAGLGATFDKDQQDFADKVYTDNAKARLVASRGDMTALKQLEHDLTAEDGRYAGKLDADKTNTLMSQVLAAQGRLEAKGQHQADKAEAVAQRALTQFDQQIVSGVPAPDDTMLAWSEAVAGGTPEQQAEWNDRLKGEAEVRTILTRPPEEQRAYVQQLQVKQQAQGATVQQQANLKRLQTGVETNLRQLKEVPLQFHALRTGEVVEPLDLQGMLSGDIGKVSGQIASRMATLQAMRKQYGPETGNAPLLPQEAAALANAFTKSTPTNAARLFGTLAGAINDPDAYRAAMQQVAPDSPVRAAAGMLYAEQRTTTLQSGGIFSGAVKASAGDVAQTMLEGEALLNKTSGAKGEDGKGGAFPMPPPKEMTEALSGMVGNAFAGRAGALETATQAVRAYYAGRAAKAGDVTGEMDPDLLRKSVRAVLGEPVDVNGSDVFPPWGMEEDDFEDKLESAWSSQSKALPEGVPTDFDDYTLQQRGGDTYYVVASTGDFLYGKDGQPLVLKVTR